jgi:hypothetical protein
MDDFVVSEGECPPGSTAGHTAAASPDTSPSLPAPTEAGPDTSNVGGADAALKTGADTNAESKAAAAAPGGATNSNGVTDSGESFPGTEAGNGWPGNGVGSLDGDLGETSPVIESDAGGNANFSATTRGQGGPLLRQDPTTGGTTGTEEKANNQSQTSAGRRLLYTGRRGGDS